MATPTRVATGANDALQVLLQNYLALGQSELASFTSQLLASSSNTTPLVHTVAALLLHGRPPTWNHSPGAPSASQLAWQVVSTHARVAASDPSIPAPPPALLTAAELAHVAEQICVDGDVGRGERTAGETQGDGTGQVPRRSTTFAQAASPARDTLAPAMLPHHAAALHRAIARVVCMLVCTCDDVEQVMMLQDDDGRQPYNAQQQQHPVQWGMYSESDTHHHTRIASVINSDSVGPKYVSVSQRDGQQEEEHDDHLALQAAALYLAGRQPWVLHAILQLLRLPWPAGAVHAEVVHADAVLGAEGHTIAAVDDHSHSNAADAAAAVNDHSHSKAADAPPYIPAAAPPAAPATPAYVSSLSITLAHAAVSFVRMLAADAYQCLVHTTSPPHPSPPTSIPPQTPPCTSLQLALYDIRWLVYIPPCATEDLTAALRGLLCASWSTDGAAGLAEAVASSDCPAVMMAFEQACNEEATMLHNTTTPWLLPLIRGTRGLLGPPPTSPPPPPTPHPLQWAALAWQRGQHPYVQAVNEMVNAALSRDWDAAEDLLRQFPFLRALVVVVAWDRVPGVVVGIAQAGREGGGGGVYRLRREIVSRLAHHQSHDQSHHQSISRLAGGWVHPDNSKSGTARYTPMSVTWELLPHMVATLEHRIAIADAVYGNTDSDAAAYAVLCQLETQSALKVVSQLQQRGVLPPPTADHLLSTAPPANLHQHTPTHDADLWFVCQTLRHVMDGCALLQQHQALALAPVGVYEDTDTHEDAHKDTHKDAHEVVKAEGGEGEGKEVVGLGGSGGECIPQERAPTNTGGHEQYTLHPTYTLVKRLLAGQHAAHARHALLHKAIQHVCTAMTSTAARVQQATTVMWMVQSVMQVVQAAGGVKEKNVQGKGGSVQGAGGMGGKSMQGQGDGVESQVHAAQEQSWLTMSAELTDVLTAAAATQRVEGLEGEEEEGPHVDDGVDQQPAVLFFRALVNMLHAAVDHVGHDVHKDDACDGQHADEPCSTENNAIDNTTTAVDEWSFRLGLVQVLQPYTMHDVPILQHWSWSTILAHLHLPPLHLLRQCLIQHQYTAAIAVATRYSLPGLEEVYVRQWIVEQVVQQQVVQQQPHERGEEEGVGLGDETTVDTAAAGGGVSGVSGVSDNDETPRGGDGGDDDALNSATSTSSTTGLRGNTAALKNMDYSRSTPVVLDFSMCPHPVTDRMQQVVLCMDTAIGVPSLSHGTTAGLLMQALGLLNEELQEHKMQEQQQQQQQQPSTSTSMTAANSMSLCTSLVTLAQDLLVLLKELAPHQSLCGALEATHPPVWTDIVTRGPPTATSLPQGPPPTSTTTTITTTAVGGESDTPGANTQPTATTAAHSGGIMLQSHAQQQGQGSGVGGPGRSTSQGLESSPVARPLVLQVAAGLRASTHAVAMALQRLHETERSALAGKQRYMSGLLHNLAKVVVAEPVPVDVWSVLLGSGYAPDVPLRTLPPSSFTGPLPSPSPSHFTTALSGTSTPALSRTTTIIPTPPYLSTMLRYLAQVGDVLSQLEKGPGEGLNYFDVLRERPTELLPRLVVQQDCADVAFRVASLFGVDLVVEVLRACLQPIYPPHTAHSYNTPTPTTPTTTLGVETQPHTAIPPTAIQGSAAIQAAPPSPIELLVGYRSGAHGGGVGDAGGESLLSGHASSSVIPTPKSASASPYTLRLAVLKSLATHNTLRAAMAAIFAIVQSIDTTTHPQGAHFGTGHGAPLVLDDAQEELLSFARDAGQESGLFCQWVESLVCPVVVLPNGRLMTPAQHEALGAEGMTHNTSPGAPKPAHRHCLRQLAPGQPGLAAELLSQVRSGAASQAITLADTIYRDGAPGWLLEAALLGVLSQQGVGAPVGVPDDCWEWAVRVDNPIQCAHLVLRCATLWSLSQAVQAVQVAVHRLQDVAVQHDDTSDLLVRMTAMQQQLSVIETVLHSHAAKEFWGWQEVHHLLHDDPGQLVKRLLTAGCPSAAALVARTTQLTGGVAHEAHASWCLSVVQLPIRQGGTFGRVLQYLTTLTVEEAACTGILLVQQLPSLQHRQLVAQYLQRLSPRLDQPIAARIAGLVVGLQVLQVLPDTQQQRYSHLVAHPGLLVESLLINQQLKLVCKVYDTIPSLCDDALLQRYAHAALRMDVHAPLSSSLSVRPTPHPHPRSNPPAHPTGSKGGVAGGRGGGGMVEAEGSLQLEGKTLTGVPVVDADIRQQHMYRTAPNLQLAKRILDLCTTPTAAATAAYHIALHLSTTCLSVTHDALSASVLLLYNVLDAANIITEMLLYARVRVQQRGWRGSNGAMGGARAAMANVVNSSSSEEEEEEEEVWMEEIQGEEAHEGEDGGPHAPPHEGMMQHGRRARASMSDIDTLLEAVQLQGTLLAALVPVGLGELFLIHGSGGGGGGIPDGAHGTSSAAAPTPTLRGTSSTTLSGGLGGPASERGPAAVVERLLTAEHYALAVFVSKKCGLDARHAWLQWACALLRVQDYDAAQIKLSMALDPSQAPCTQTTTTTGTTHAPKSTATIQSSSTMQPGIVIQEYTLPVGAPDAATAAAEFCARLEFDRSTPLVNLQRLASALRAAAFADEQHGLAAGDYLQVLQLPGDTMLAATQHHGHTTPPAETPTTPSVDTPVNMRTRGGASESTGSLTRGSPTPADGSLRGHHEGVGGGGVEGGSVTGGRSVTSPARSTALSRWAAFMRARQDPLLTHAQSPPPIEPQAGVRLDPHRVALIVRLLDTHAPELLLGFLFRQARYEEACRLPFTLDHDGDDQGVNPLHSHTHSPTPHQPAAALVPSVSHGGKSDDNVHGDSDDGDAAADDDHDDNDDGGGLAPWQQVAARVQRYGGINVLCTLCWEYAHLPTLLNVLQSCPPSGGGDWGMTLVCMWLRQQGHWRHLCDFQLAMELYDAAGMSCIALTRTAPDLPTAATHLHDAITHFQRAMQVRQRQQQQQSQHQAAMGGGSLHGGSLRRGSVSGGSKKREGSTATGKVLWGSPAESSPTLISTLMSQHGVAASLPTLDHPTHPPTPAPPPTYPPPTPPHVDMSLPPPQWLQRGTITMTIAELATAITQCNLQLEVYQAVQIHLTAHGGGSHGWLSLRKPWSTPEGTAHGNVSGAAGGNVAAALAPVEYSLFPPNIPLSPSEAAVAVEARLSEVLELLLRCDFDLAFRVIHEFGMSPVRAYACAAAAMARANNHDALGQLLFQIDRMTTDEERDQVLAAGVQGYIAGGWGGGATDWSHYFAGGLGNPAERLVELMRDPAARVGGYCRLGLLQQALQEALAVEDVGCVAMVAEAAVGDTEVHRAAMQFLNQAYGRV